mgnify:CR=1 FL=1
MKPVLETKSTYKGYPYVVLFMPGAYRCGYVGVPYSHKLAKKSVDDLWYLDCHGGVTYAKSHLYDVMIKIHGGLDLTVLIVSMVMILRKQNSISGKSQSLRKCLK